MFSMVTLVLLSPALWLTASHEAITPAAQGRAPLPRISACSLLTKAEVKQHLPWMAALDAMPLEEDEIGPSGSGCSYPSVYVQVLANPQSMIDAARSKGGLETVSGVGDEAYFHDNKGMYAEVYVRVGARILTLQANVPPGGSAQSVRPAAVSLAKAFATKLPR